jgi:hypothetical protein
MQDPDLCVNLVNVFSLNSLQEEVRGPGKSTMLPLMLRRDAQWVSRWPIPNGLIDVISQL